MAQVTLGVRVSALEKTVRELATKQELHAVRDDLRAEMQTMREDLRAEIRAGDEETRRYMRVLHEDVIERIERLRG